MQRFPLWILGTTSHICDCHKPIVLCLRSSLATVRDLCSKARDITNFLCGKWNRKQQKRFFDLRVFCTYQITNRALQLVRKKLSYAQGTNCLEKQNSIQLHLYSAFYCTTVLSHGALQQGAPKSNRCMEVSLKNLTLNTGSSFSSFKSKVSSWIAYSPICHFIPIVYCTSWVKITVFFNI